MDSDIVKLHKLLVDRGVGCRFYSGIHGDTLMGEVFKLGRFIISSPGSRLRITFMKDEKPQTLVAGRDDSPRQFLISAFKRIRTTEDF